VTYLFRRAQDPHQTLARWHKLKGAASKRITELGGTITHQHGVGLDHKPYLNIEKDPMSMQILKKVIRTVDPDQIMNTGKLIDLD
jgi:alkyldihydroxyacetonephosphate synthase